MEIELLFFEGCPNWRLADDRLREALAAVGDHGATLTHRVVSGPDEAELVGLRGSPTILVDGRDPFARPDDPVGLACRLYPDAGKDDHAPTVDQLKAVLAGRR